MRRTLLLAVVAAAAFIPAGVGLAGNASFSQSVPAPVPPSGQVITPMHDTGDDSRTQPATGTPRPTATTHTSEPGDDHGGDRVRASEPGDDHGGDRVRVSEPGDDHGGDRVGSSGHGSDDGPGHD